jgi:hypothetical protein
VSTACWTESLEQSGRVVGWAPTAAGRRRGREPMQSKKSQKVLMADTFSSVQIQIRNPEKNEAMFRALCRRTLGSRAWIERPG